METLKKWWHDLAYAVKSGWLTLVVMLIVVWAGVVVYTEIRMASEYQRISSHTSNHESIVDAKLYSLSVDLAVSQMKVEGLEKAYSELEKKLANSEKATTLLAKTVSDSERSTRVAETDLRKQIDDVRGSVSNVAQIAQAAHTVASEAKVASGNLDADFYRRANEVSEKVVDGKRFETWMLFNEKVLVSALHADLTVQGENIPHTPMFIADAGVVRGTYRGKPWWTDQRVNPGDQLTFEIFPIGDDGKEVVLKAQVSRVFRSEIGASPIRETWEIARFAGPK